MHSIALGVGAITGTVCSLNSNQSLSNNDYPAVLLKSNLIPPATAQISFAPPSTELRFRPSPEGRVNSQGNSIYLQDLYLNGQLYTTLDAVSGRHYTQSRNRHVSGTEAPLPDGSYTISHQFMAPTHREVGGVFMQITLRFRTGRTALGIHYDPSFGLNKGEDGTASCIALTTTADRDFVKNFILQYRPQLLTVEIQ